MEILHIISMVKALQYLTITRPHLSYTINKYCRFMDEPLQPHWLTVKHILRYLSGIICHGLVLKPST